MGEAYEWITEWTIDLIPRWGQYQNCNGYNPPSCLGASDFYVGHEAAQGLGLPTGGQCTTTLKVAPTLPGQRPASRPGFSGG